MSSQTRALSKELEPSVAASSLVAVLHGYQRCISPLLSPACRFHPSCSAYAVEAIQVHGAIRGCWLALRRLLRCGPWHPGGVDPVPLGSAHQPTDLRRQPYRVSTTPAEE